MQEAMAMLKAIHAQEDREAAPRKGMEAAQREAARCGKAAGGRA